MFNLGLNIYITEVKLFWTFFLMLVFCKFLELIYCSSFLRLFPLPGVVSSQNIYSSVLNGKFRVLHVSSVFSVTCLSLQPSAPWTLVTWVLSGIVSTQGGRQLAWLPLHVLQPPVLLPECFTPDFSCGICRVHLIYFLNLTSHILCLLIMWSIVSCIFAWLFNCCILEVNLITDTSSCLKVEVRTWNFIQSVV